ncbi:MAG: hypothetical protein AB2693_17535 [Candidatus Thiodiazotropha sp.]
MNKLFSETTGPIVTKLQTEHPGDGGMKLSLGLGHMTKIAATPLYNKNRLKIFFFTTKRPMALELGTKHRWTEPYQVCSNKDPTLIGFGPSMLRTKPQGHRPSGYKEEDFQRVFII